MSKNHIRQAFGYEFRWAEAGKREREKEREGETADSRYFQIRKKLTSRPPLVYNPLRVRSLTCDPVQVVVVVAALLAVVVVVVVRARRPGRGPVRVGGGGGQRDGGAHRGVHRLQLGVVAVWKKDNLRFSCEGWTNRRFHDTLLEIVRMFARFSMKSDCALYFL